ncbi:MAG TPA: hypothetical protein VFX85_11105 [Solirubrobacterales bacterium]|nr:hypothetical protein [Solirubrobacterales bacterium]
MRRALPIALLAGCLLAFAPAAGASYDPLASGTATLTLDRSFAAYLKANGIQLSATAPARRQGAKLTLPVSGGEWDPTTGKGSAETEGAIVFTGRKRVPLRELVVKAKPTPLLARVGGGQLKVASSKRVMPARLGFGAKLTATKLLLTAKVATRLNKKLRPGTPFRAGQVIGRLTATVAPATVAVLPQGRAYVTPTPEIRAKLDALFVSVNPIAPAELAPGPVFSLPIGPESQIAPDGSSGTLHTTGTLEFLQLGAGQVFWAEQWLDLAARGDSAEVNLQPSPPFGGKQGRVGVLALGGGTVSADPKTRTVSVNGASLTLSESAAGAFNEAFAQGKPPIFAAGEVLGSLSFTAQGQ